MEVYTLAVFKEGGTLYYDFDNLAVAVDEALFSMKHGATPVNITNAGHEVVYNYHDILALKYTKGK
jgi:hypothetical protein